MPEPSRGSNLEDRKRDAARAGLNLSDERVAELMSRFDEGNTWDRRQSVRAARRFRSATVGPL